MRFFLLIVNITIDVILAPRYLINTDFYQWISRRSRGSWTPTLIILGADLFFHTVVIALIVTLYSVEVAVLLSSYLFLHWAYILYYRQQKFAWLERPYSVSNNPIFYPACVLLANLSTSVAIVSYIGSIWVLGLIPLWLIYGYSCAELAIRRNMKRYKRDRKTAISSINYHARNGDLNIRSKYPFP